MHKWPIDVARSRFMFGAVAGNYAQTEMTMSTNETSQTQQSSTPFSTPFAWQRAIAEQMDRWDAVVTDVVTAMGKLETKGFEQACANADEAARLTKESAAYASLLGAQWRKLAMDATRQAFETFGAKV
jgi:hypothetical protein